MDEAKKTSVKREQKIENVSALKEKLTKAKTLFITEYRGLTHQQMEQLRKGLKKAEAEFVVAKNTLLKIALKDAGLLQDELEKQLVNPTATLLAFGDEIAAIKELANFIKLIQLPKVKVGLFGGKLATETDFKKLASLPTRDILLATLAMRLKSPIYGLHYALRWNLQGLVVALDAIKSKKPAATN